MNSQELAPEVLLCRKELDLRGYLVENYSRIVSCEIEGERFVFTFRASTNDEDFILPNEFKDRPKTNGLKIQLDTYLGEYEGMQTCVVKAPKIEFKAIINTQNVHPDLIKYYCLELNLFIAIILSDLAGDHDD